MQESRWKCFALCAFSVSVVVVLVLLLSKLPSKSGDIASWVQAIGSILAIFGSAYVSFRIAEQSHKMERYRAVESALAISEVLREEAMRVVVEFDKNYEEAFLGVHSVYRKNLCEALVAALDKIPVHDLPSKDFVSEVVNLQQRWHYFLWALDRFNGGVFNASGYKETYDLYRKHNRLDDEEIRDLPNKFRDQAKEQVQLALASSERFKVLMTTGDGKFR